MEIRPGRGVSERWRFFRSRYRSNLENPPASDPARQISKSRAAIAWVGAIGVISVLLATVGGDTAAWFGAAAMAMLVLTHLRIIRRMRAMQERSRSDSAKHARR